MIPLLYVVGERNCLHPLTESMAAPLLPIANRPVVIYAVELLARFGYRKILVSLHDMADQVEQTLGNGQRWNVLFDYLLQRQPLSINKLLRQAATQLTETSLILPADMLIDFDIHAALAFHRLHGAEATVLLYPAEEAPATTPILATNQISRIVMPRAAQPACFVNTQIYLLEPTVLPKLVTEAVDHEQSLLTLLLDNDIPVHGHVLEGYWNPLSSFAEIQAAQQAVLAEVNKATVTAPDTHKFIHDLFVEGRQVGPGVWAGQATSLHPSVQITPPVYIGPNCRVGRNVELGPETVIGANCVVDDGATIRQSTVLADTYVGQLTNVDHRIVHQGLLIDIETGEHVYITDQFLLGAVGAKAVNTVVWNAIERFLALIGLGIALPLLLLISCLIWLSEGSALFTCAEYVGRKPSSLGGERATAPQIIRLHHLRTRREDGTAIWLGAWLETTEIYRLPELWDVVRNEIGLVGVKPLSSEVAARIVEPWQQKRYDCPTGFTGFWYTQTVADCTLDELCIVDVYHAAIYSRANALRCLWRTPGAWLWRLRYAWKGEDVEASSVPSPLYKYKQFARLVNSTHGESTPHDGTYQ